MVDLEKFKYNIIRNFLDQSEVDLLKEYCISKHKDNRDSFDLNQTNTGDTSFYKDPLMQIFLKKKKNIIEKNLNLELDETYTFWRCYTYNATLEKHTDRPSCELSASIHIDSDGTKWPIFMGGEPVELNPGDAVIYSGCNIEHWREPFEGDYHIQTFFHYVNANGPYAQYKGDMGKPQ